MVDLLDPRSFSRKDQRPLADLLDSRIRQEMDIAKHNSDLRAADQQAQQQGYTLDQLGAIQPGVMEQMRGANQDMLAPPPVAQAAAPGATPLSPQEVLMQERERLLGQNQSRAAAIAVNPLLGALQEAQGQNLAGREKLAGERAGIALGNEWSSIVPELEGIKNTAVQTMSANKANRIESIDTWNRMIADIQGKVASKNPKLLENKGFQEYLNNLEKLKPAPNPDQGQGFRREKFADDKEQKLYDRVARFRKETESQRDAASHLGNVDAVLQKIGAGGIYGDPNKVDVPGFGVGERAFRKYAQSEDAVELRSAVAALYNAYRNGLFGSALTEGEVKAFEEFAGNGLVSNQAALFAGLKGINRALSQRLRPETKDMEAALDQAGIMDYRGLPKEVAKTQKTKMTDADIDKMSKEELEAFLKDN